jgi:rubrerythrin
MSKTQENLMAAFAGESQARNMYTYFAKVARKEGYHYIAKIFEETAINEMRHAKDEFVLAGKLGDTVANLKEAIAGEHHETTTMYPEFAEQADADGNKEAAILFRMIARVEAEHRDRYKKLLEMVENGTVFKREEKIRWKCSVCGYIHEGTEPPGKCPCCKHGKEYYEPEGEF